MKIYAKEHLALKHIELTFQLKHSGGHHYCISGQQILTALVDSHCSSCIIWWVLNSKHQSFFFIKKIIRDSTLQAMAVKLWNRINGSRSTYPPYGVCLLVICTVWCFLLNEDSHMDVSLLFLILNSLCCISFNCSSRATMFFNWELPWTVHFAVFQHQYCGVSYWQLFPCIFSTSVAYLIFVSLSTEALIWEPSRYDSIPHEFYISSMALDFANFLQCFKTLTSFHPLTWLAEILAQHYPYNIVFRVLNFQIIWKQWQILLQIPSNEKTHMLLTGPYDF